MQLHDKSGICCDACGIVYKTDFTYYSLDFRHIDVINNIRTPIDNIIRSNIVFSIDMCTNCFDSIKNIIIKNYSATMSPHRLGKQLPVTCEITGGKLFGTYEYYYCVVSKADIRLSGQPNICVKCKNKTFDSGTKCMKCSGSEFMRIASAVVDDRHVEFTICVDAYKSFVDKAQQIRVSAGQWTTR